ncbi:colicin-like pore-forming protein [Avibacterium avium]|uniref:colicin-like pore-forming protein n=1 Tax=Avibacterium avium TaxID=751 RepID=UPI0039FDBCC6
MSNESHTSDPVIVIRIPSTPAPITIDGKPYYPGPSFGVSYETPPHIVVKPVNLQLGRVGLVNLAEFTIKIRDIDGVIEQYNAQLSKSEIHSTISEAKKWLDEYALDFENSREIEVYIEMLESTLDVLKNAENSLVALQQDANKKFDALLNNNIVRLGNFKKYKDSKPWLISAAYESNIAYFGSSKMRQEYIRLWKANVEEPQSKILIEKQKIEASLSSLSETNKSLDESLKNLKQKAQKNEIQTNAEYASAFFEHITEKYGDLAAKEARKLVESVKGKKIRSVDEAIKAFDKYKGSINKKFSLEDREAVSKALHSLDMKSISDDLYKFNKAFKFTGKAFSVFSLKEALQEGYQNGNWKPFYLELEKQALDKAATYVAGITLAALAGTPLGIIGYGVLMVVTSALISDELVEKIHRAFFE